MLQNAYFLAKIGADTAENEQHFAEILTTDALCRHEPRSRREPACRPPPLRRGEPVPGPFRPAFWHGYIGPGIPEAVKIGRKNFYKYSVFLITFFSLYRSKHYWQKKENHDFETLRYFNFNRISSFEPRE